MVNPIHKISQSRKVTTGELKDWVNSLVVSLSAESVNLDNDQSLDDCVKLSALDTLQLDLPALPIENRVAGGFALY